MLANSGWPAFYFARDIAQTSYLVLGSLLLETLALWYALRRRAARVKVPEGQPSAARFRDALFTATLANAASLAYGFVLIPTTDIGLNSWDMGAIDMNAAFWVYWVPGCLIEIAVVAIHRRLFDPLTIVVIAASNLATWHLMKIVPQLPLIDLHPPG